MSNLKSNGKRKTSQFNYSRNITFDDFKKLLPNGKTRVAIQLFAEYNFWYILDAVASNLAMQVAIQLFAEYNFWYYKSSSWLRRLICRNSIIRGI